MDPVTGRRSIPAEREAVWWGTMLVHQMDPVTGRRSIPAEREAVW